MGLEIKVPSAMVLDYLGLGLNDFNIDANYLRGPSRWTRKKLMAGERVFNIVSLDWKTLYDQRTSFSFVANFSLSIIYEGWREL